MRTTTTPAGPQPDSLFHDGYPFNVAAWLPPAADAAATPAQIAHHQRYTRIGDPAADAVVEMFRTLSSCGQETCGDRTNPAHR